MLNQTGARRGRPGPAGAIGWWVALLTCAVGAVATATAAPAEEETYRWHGELVALDEAAGTVTIKSPLVTPVGLEAAAGEPILITWSGAESQASGIRAVAHGDGAELAAGGEPAAAESEAPAEDVAEAEEPEEEESPGFLLQATFVAVDADRRHLTFEVALPAESLGTVRALTRGSWVTATSVHRPTEAETAPLAVDAYSPSPEWRTAPARGATYRWQGELVALDEATDMLTVKSRVASPSGLAALAGAKAGEPIVITWSGFESRASGVRAALPDDGSGLWGSNRFLLRATFVESDAQGRYLTFKTAVPEDSLTTVRALTRGAWASVISPHHPADGIPAVLSVDAYVPLRERRPAPLPGATYRWDGELLELDEATRTLTVKSRVASPSGLTAVAGAETGEPIVITWSGYQNQASGDPRRTAGRRLGPVGRQPFSAAGDVREYRRPRPLPDLQDRGARGQSGDGAGADARLLGERAVAAPPGGRSAGGAVGRCLCAVAGAPARAAAGCYLPLGRRAGCAGRGDRYADRQVAGGLAVGSGRGGRRGDGRADRHHLVGL